MNGAPRVCDLVEGYAELLSTSNNFLFIHVPKTGGNSIQKALFPFSDDQIALTGPHHDGIERFEIRSPEFEIHKHSTLQEYRHHLGWKRFSSLVKVTCVRNPWDRCVSFFFSPHRGNVEWSPQVFEDFVRNVVQPQAHYLTLEGRENDPFQNVDVVLRFESLETDFRALCQRLALGELALPRINASNRSDYRSYFTTDRLIELVAEKFSPEIRRFNYEF